jgi:SAM-dependent methyltransferase
MEIPATRDSGILIRSERTAVQTDDSPINNLTVIMDFVKSYVASRETESRIYADDVVEQLPSVDPSHIHYAEWMVRKRSAGRLIRYLQGKARTLSILEVGCGNGWLSGRLAEIKDVQVTGIDINSTELTQAKNIFKNRNIQFKTGDIRQMAFEKKMDMIIFAASIQYFQSFEQVIGIALSLLKKDGEIHILDSHFYKAGDAGEAKKRTDGYYRSIGHAEMSAFYFHHTIQSLNRFNYRLLFNPSGLKNKLTGKKDPFPWICISSS